MQKPSIGRIVHYNRANSEDSLTQEAALIIAVHDDTTVTLQVCNAGGTWTTEHSVAQGTADDTWMWPPRT